MVEIAMHDELDRPFLERLADGTVRVHAALHHNANLIVDALAELWRPGEADAVLGIMANDEQQRTFEKGEQVLFIKRA